MDGEPRRPGEKFGPDNLSHFLAPGDFDAPLEPQWNYIGTIDNDATITQLHFLAKTIAAGGESAAYRAAFARGIEYLLAAQYPNGGWPQVWPLEGGYHDAVTFNDDAMTQVVDLMHDVAAGGGDFAFVPVELRARAQAAFERGIRCILAAQIKVGGVLTVWPQQADALTLEPVSGRNFEPPAPCSAESSELALLLMNDLPKPDAEVQRAVRAAVAWFGKTALHGRNWKRTAEGRRLVPDPAAGPIWARYYQSGVDAPVFGDRDKSLHDNVNELTPERRNGYAWYNSDPKRALDRFAVWSKEHPEHP
jgi:PelA/Pel-15E family pectate lyase